jgi:hypothetical protein
MSEAYFNYAQYTLCSMASQLESDTDEFIKAKGFTDKVEPLLRQTVSLMKVTAKLMHRVDHLLVDNDSEEECFKRVCEDLRQVKSDGPSSILYNKLITALELLKTAECSGEAYTDITKRSEWRKKKETLLNEFEDTKHEDQ